MQFCRHRLPATVPPGAHATAACSTRQATHRRRRRSGSAEGTSDERPMALNDRGPAWHGGSGDGALRGCRRGGRRVPAPVSEQPTAPINRGLAQRGGSGERRPSRLPAWRTTSSSSTRRLPAYSRKRRPECSRSRRARRIGGWNPDTAASRRPRLQSRRGVDG
jgi:hypothetical protein